MRAFVLAVLMLFVGKSAEACPVCRTPTGDAVLAGISGGDFPRNAFASVLPFAVVGGLVGAVGRLLARVVDADEQER